MRIVPRQLEKRGQEAAPVVEPEQPQYNLPIAAHELGHAARFEGRRFPGLRHALERGLRWGGLGGEISAVVQGRPLLAAGMAGLRNLPELVEEAGASLRADKALREAGVSPEDLSASRKHLLHAGSTYLGGALGEAGGIAGSAALSKKLISLIRSGQIPPEAIRGPVGAGLLLPPLIGTAAGAGLANIGYNKRMQKGPSTDMATIEKMRQAMGVKAGLHRAAEVGEGKNFGGGGAYIHKLPDLVNEPSEEEIEETTKLLHGGTEDQVRDIINRGGIMLSAIHPKKKTAAAEEKKPSLAHRVGKKLGLGALSTAVAAPIVFATLPKGTREAVYGKIREIGGKLTKKAQKDETALGSRETLAQAHHWSSLASALVR